MLEMAGQIDRLKAELLRLRQRADAAQPGAEMPAQERPPHY